MSDLNNLTNQELIEGIDSSIEEMEGTLSNAESNVDYAENTISDAESSIQTAYDEVHHAKRDLRETESFLSSLNIEFTELKERFSSEYKSIEVFVFYIGGKVDSYHKNKDYIKMFAELYPSLIDTMAVEEYHIKTLEEMLHFMEKMTQVMIEPISLGIIKRTKSPKITSETLSGIDLIESGDLNRVSFYRNNSNGQDFNEWLDCKD